MPKIDEIRYICCDRISIDTVVSLRWRSLSCGESSALRLGFSCLQISISLANRSLSCAKLAKDL
jgi:hypothetical protein